MRAGRPESLAATSAVLVIGVVSYAVAGPAWAVLAVALAVAAAAVLLADDE